MRLGGKYFELLSHITGPLAASLPPFPLSSPPSLPLFLLPTSSSSLKLTTKILRLPRTVVLLSSFEGEDPGHSWYRGLSLPPWPLPLAHLLCSFHGRPERWLLLPQRFSTQDLLWHQLSIKYRHNPCLPGLSDLPSYHCVCLSSFPVTH